MSSLFVFCIQICLIQYAIGQRVNAPSMVNNGIQHGPSIGHAGPLQGAALGRIPAELGGVKNGPVGPIPNQALGPHGLIMPNGQAFPGPMPNQGFPGSGMPNNAYAGAGMANNVYAGAGMPNQFYGGAGMPNAAYGGSGTGEVIVNGELPVSGMTAVTGHVPMTGKVAFSGNVPCGGIVTITGSCTSCGHNAPYGQNQMAAYGNKPYGY